MPRRMNKRKRPSEEALRLLAEAPKYYHRINSHAGDASECMVCRSKDFRPYVGLFLVYDDQEGNEVRELCVDVARMYREALGV